MLEWDGSAGKLLYTLNKRTSVRHDKKELCCCLLIVSIRGKGEEIKIAWQTQCQFVLGCRIGLIVRTHQLCRFIPGYRHGRTHRLCQFIPDYRHGRTHSLCHFIPDYRHVRTHRLCQFISDYRHIRTHCLCQSQAIGMAGHSNCFISSQAICMNGHVICINSSRPIGMTATIYFVNSSQTIGMDRHMIIHNHGREYWLCQFMLGCREGRPWHIGYASSFWAIGYAYKTHSLYQLPLSSGRGMTEQWSWKFLSSSDLVISGCYWGREICYTNNVGITRYPDCFSSS